MQRGIIPGGPTKPDVTNMSEANARNVLKAYSKARKAYTDKQRFERAKAVKSDFKVAGSFIQYFDVFWIKHMCWIFL